MLVIMLAVHTAQLVFYAPDVPQRKWVWETQHTLLWLAVECKQL